MHHEAAADSADSNKNMTFAVHPTRANLLSSRSSLRLSSRGSAVGTYVNFTNSSLASRCYRRCLFQHIIPRTSESRFFQLSPVSRRALAKSLGSRALLAAQFRDKIKLPAKLSFYSPALFVSPCPLNYTLSRTNEQSEKRRSISITTRPSCHTLG